MFGPSVDASAPPRSDLGCRIETESRTLPGARRASSATPTGCVGMVGAGQLARMTQQAAISLGVTLRVLAESADDPAVSAGAELVVGSPTYLRDLETLAVGCDVVTFDHERIPPEHLEELEIRGVRLSPSSAAKLMAQDKLHARRVLAAGGFPVPPFVHAKAPEELDAFAATHGWPLVLKAPRGGYDGRGVRLVDDATAAAHALSEMPGGALTEPKLELERELAVLVARSASGEHAVYPVVETVQQEAMCREILAPAPISSALAEQARELAVDLVMEIGAVGVVAVEMFVTAGGLMVNELALRPHNSAHYTIEGCVTSQFEQHLRAVLGWPLGLPSLVAPAVATVNVVGRSEGGDPRERVTHALGVPGAHLHLYGKSPRPERKLGHVTVCGEDPASVRDAARLAAGLLEGETA